MASLNIHFHILIWSTYIFDLPLTYNQHFGRDCYAFLFCGHYFIAVDVVVGWSDSLWKSNKKLNTFSFTQ